MRRMLAVGAIIAENQPSPHFMSHPIFLRAATMPNLSVDRVHLDVAEAQGLSERAMRGIGYDDEARILADHVIDAALCGYEYSGLPKLLNIIDSPDFKNPRHPLRIVKETSVSALIDAATMSACSRSTTPRGMRSAGRRNMASPSSACRTPG